MDKEDAGSSPDSACFQLTRRDCCSCSNASFSLACWDVVAYQIAPLPSPTCFSRANLFLGSYCFSSSCSSPFIPLSPLAFPRVLVQGTYLPIACSHTSTSSALQFSSQVTCSLPLSWQEAACRITNTDLASQLTPPPPAPSHFRAQLKFYQWGTQDPFPWRARSPVEEGPNPLTHRTQADTDKQA